MAEYFVMMMNMTSGRVQKPHLQVENIMLAHWFYITLNTVSTIFSQK